MRSEMAKERPAEVRRLRDLSKRMNPNPSTIELMDGWMGSCK